MGMCRFTQVGTRKGGKHVCQSDFLSAAHPCRHVHHLHSAIGFTQGTPCTCNTLKVFGGSLSLCVIVNVLIVFKLCESLEKNHSCAKMNAKRLHVELVSTRIGTPLFNCFIACLKQRFLSFRKIFPSRTWTPVLAPEVKFSNSFSLPSNDQKGGGQLANVLFVTEQCHKTAHATEKIHNLVRSIRGVLSVL